MRVLAEKVAINVNDVARRTVQVSHILISIDVPELTSTSSGAETAAATPVCTVRILT